MSLTRLNKRAVLAHLQRSARQIVNDLVVVVAQGVAQDAPRDTEFLAETVEAIRMGETGKAPKVERRRSQRTGESVERVSHQAPQLEADTAALHVAADYAIDAEIREPFIWPNVEAAAQALPDVVAQRRA
jgi:hypothetical protein